MRTRRAARLLIINNTNDVLLFRFTHRDDALAGRSYWAPPAVDLKVMKLSSRLLFESFTKKRE